MSSVSNEGATVVGSCSSTRHSVESDCVVNFGGNIQNINLVLDITCSRHLGCVSAQMWVAARRSLHSFFEDDDLGVF